MNAIELQAERFEANRPHLLAVAYRILGSVGDAEDAVQEAWLRLSRADGPGVENMRGWLTTVVSRICLDMLRARRSRREELVDGWEQAPIVQLDGPADPEAELLLADSVGLALLVVLDTLSPPERLAFVLHDMFGVPFDEIAPIVDRSEPATRQLASRARRRIRSGGTEQHAGRLAAERPIVDAFLAAAREGSFEALVAVLDPDVEFTADRALADDGPVALAGAATVAPVLLERGAPFNRFARPAVVDGRAGLVVVAGGRVLAVLGFSFAGGRISALRLTRDPARLRAVRP
jgi:RNA polymerase sigma-70 factor (ECF subfamily)